MVILLIAHLIIWEFMQADAEHFRGGVIAADVVDDPPNSQVKIYYSWRMSWWSGHTEEGSLELCWRKSDICPSGDSYLNLVIETTDSFKHPTNSLLDWLSGIGNNNSASYIPYIKIKANQSNWYTVRFASCCWIAQVTGSQFSLEMKIDFSRRADTGPSTEVRERRCSRW